MLVLSRGYDTAIQIGTDIKVRVLSISKRRVKLGIDAPKNVCVYREEISATRLVGDEQNDKRFVLANR